ncbi:hypothetical protein QCA50_017819 [Cerrena zonata]|uniref:SMP-LTD domain-containing protein n=1 Tax=Cerrena zonata TaxID=2478898 RepID=A0AAW0FES4_9APHY
MNPELTHKIGRFTSLIDMLEDIMPASVPSFIHSVRIADLGLGKTAARITSILSLPGAKTRERLKATRGQEANTFNERSEDTSGPNKDQEEELSGDHVNVEVSFAYRGLPSGKSIISKAMNVHLLVDFFLGIRGVRGLKVPIWVEVTGTVGTARARLQLISDPPFVKTTMVSSMDLPRITISVVPLNKILPSVMDIPFVSGFISSAIDTAVAEYVAPNI